MSLVLEGIPEERTSGEDPPESSPPAGSSWTRPRLGTTRNSSPIPWPSGHSNNSTVVGPWLVALDLHTTEFQLAEATFQLFEAGLVVKSGEVIPPEGENLRQHPPPPLGRGLKALGDRRFAEAANMYRYLVKMTPADGSDPGTGPG